MAETMHCYRHPRRETKVSCATCGRPICTECMRQTDVGIKCPDDARLPRGARAGAMKTGQIARTILAGAAVAIVGVPVVYALFQIGFFTLILSAAVGYGAGTLVHRAGGRNGGPPAMAVSGIAVTIAFAPLLTQQFLAGGPFPFIRLVAAIIAIGFAVYNSR
ncbi:hypothetical protein BH18ACT10_BH18ACT10_02720 [soil metagenome]|nr:hypothetical protein [Rubrobacter sp.]